MNLLFSIVESLERTYRGFYVFVRMRIKIDGRPAIRCTECRRFFGGFDFMLTDKFEGGIVCPKCSAGYRVVKQKVDRSEI